MAVEEKKETTPPAASDNGAGKPGSKQQGSWFKQHKAIALIGGAGVLVLVLSHKGKGTGTEKSATEAAEKQQAADNALVAARAGGIDTPGGTGEVGGSGGTGSTPAAPAPGAAATEDPQIAALTTAVERETEAASRSAAALPPNTSAEEANTVAEAGNPGAAAKKPAAKAAAKAKPKPKAPHKPGVTVKGRHFAGATGHHTSPVHKHSNGSTKQHVTVHYPGRTVTHTAHNGGASWTDHTPGHNPPSRKPQAHTAPHHPAPKPPARRPAPKKPAPRRRARAA